MSEITSEQIATNYAAMVTVSGTINKIIAGGEGEIGTEEEKQESIDTCVKHLQLMVGKDYWTDEDMELVNAAITAGLAY
jgi:hypothetical protein|tara:strand:+ start:245 stop:481 length:237 start_codon:yes stop_codon:yes gene_type:complete